MDEGFVIPSPITLLFCLFFCLFRGAKILGFAKRSLLSVIY